MSYKYPDPVRLKKSVSLLESFFGEPVQNIDATNLLDALIHTILSQSTNDLNCDRAFKSLREKFPTNELLYKAPAVEIAGAIRQAGLYRQKSERIKNILRWVKSGFGKLNIDEICDWPTGKVLSVFTAQKGIGVKTVAVLLLFKCGRDIFPVDTHVHRIAKRLNLVPGNASPGKTFAILNPAVPEGKSYSYHVNLLKLGRRICLAKKPRCVDCPLQPICRRRLQNDA